MQHSPALILPIHEDRLIDRFIAGDLDAFRRIYALYEAQVFRHAFYLLQNPDEADDVKQETFLRAYRACRSFRGGSSLLTWLLKICRNRCYDRLARRRRSPEILCDPHLLRDYNAATEELVDPHAALDRAETIGTVLRALGGLSVAHRELVILRLVEGRDYTEIAAILGCRLPTARTRVLRAVRLLKERIESMMGERI